MRNGPTSRNQGPSKTFKIKKTEKTEVINMVDLSTKTIKDLFNQQISNMTRRTIDSFDYQFSDRWIQ